MPQSLYLKLVSLILTLHKTFLPPPCRLTQDSHVHTSSSYQRICTAYTLVYQSKKLACMLALTYTICSLQVSIYCSATDTIVVSDQSETFEEFSTIQVSLPDSIALNHLFFSMSFPAAYLLILPIYLRTL